MIQNTFTVVTQLLGMDFLKSSYTRSMEKDFCDASEYTLKNFKIPFNSINLKVQYLLSPQKSLPFLSLPVLLGEETFSSPPNFQLHLPHHPRKSGNLH